VDDLTITALALRALRLAMMLIDQLSTRRERNELYGALKASENALCQYQDKLRTE